jgi:hypothetical protein
VVVVVVTDGIDGGRWLSPVKYSAYKGIHSLLKKFKNHSFNFCFER